MKKNKKKKNKKSKRKLLKKTKRLSATKRIPRKKKSPFKIVIRNWDVEPFNPKYQKEILLNEDSNLIITIDEDEYQISIDKKNRCVRFSTRENHLYLQPVSVKTFLIKANSKIKENEN